MCVPYIPAVQRSALSVRVPFPLFFWFNFDWRLLSFLFPFSRNRARCVGRDRFAISPSPLVLNNFNVRLDGLVCTVLWRLACQEGALFRRLRTRGREATQEAGSGWFASATLLSFDRDRWHAIVVEYGDRLALSRDSRSFVISTAGRRSSRINLFVYIYICRPLPLPGP